MNIITLDKGTLANPHIIDKLFGKEDYVILTSGVYILQGGVTINEVKGTTIIHLMRGSSQVNVMWGSSQVKEMWGSSQVKEMWGSSQVNVMRESSQVKEMWGSSQVNVMWGSSQVNVMRESSQVKEMWGSSQVKEMWGSSLINSILGDFVVIVCKGYNIVRTTKQSKCKVELNETSQKIILPDIQGNFDVYSKNYPVNIKGKKATMYKAVHKKSKGKYFADYDKSFVYELGKKYKHNIDTNTAQSCKEGLHISHLMWAVRFGTGWQDLAVIECEVPIDKIVVAADCDGKVRTSDLKVVRELDKSEYEKYL